MNLPASSTVLLAVAAMFCFCEETAGPWPKSDVVEPAQLAKILETAKPPVIISVAYPVLYHARHIVHAIEAGPGSNPAGIEALKKAVAKLPKDADIVVYCGCCPMEKCPNVRPAYRALKELGYTHVRVLDIQTNMHDDWYAKNFPSEEGAKNGK